MPDLSLPPCEDDRVTAPPPTGPSPGLPAGRGSGQLHVGTLDHVGGRIVGGKLAPGDVLTLERLSREYAVSVPVAREVVRVLESMGMVRSRRRVGVTVLPREEWNAFDPRLIRWRLASSDRLAQLQSLSELRRGFEPVAAALAAQHATSEQCGALAGAVSDMVVHGHAGDLEAYLVADVAFHRTLLEASGNEMFRALGDVVEEVLVGRTHHDLMPSRPDEGAIELHEVVARAVRTGDAPAAERAMREVIEEAAAAVQQPGG
jgi:DNA-binding FadR family transcriptional regulator